MSSFFLVCAMSMATAQIWLQDGQVFFRYNDSLGAQNFPVYEGVVTSPMLPLVQRAARDLKVFDGTVLVSWPVEKCKFDKSRPMLVDCTGPGQILMPENSGLTTTGISTTIEKNERVDLSYDRLKINWGLDTSLDSYVHYFVTFPFDKNHCEAKAE